MIRMIQSSSAGHAKAYFTEALAKADYYINDQELQGCFEGRLAERLGIDGIADRKTFFHLCDNVNPTTGQSLTPRNKEDRTVGYDINFHAPKSVSIVHALSKDDHLLKAFEASVRDTMKEIEADSMTRVRKKKSYEDRKTGELVYAFFTHQTARPVDGYPPDPHLHGHCYVFNATWDSEEQRVKAGQFREINRDMPYYQARFQKRLADNLIELGYQVHKTEKAFEITGVPKEAIALFSKRTDEIGRVAKEKGIADPKAMSELGAKTRSAKQKGMNMSELKTAWRAQLRENTIDDNKSSEAIIRNGQQPKKIKVNDARDCVDHSLKHHFERASVAQERRLIEAACKHSIGEKHISLSAIEAAFEKDDRIIRVQDRGRTACTMTHVLTEERQMVQLARKGQGKFKPYYFKPPEIQLKGGQGAAIEYVLTNPHQVNLVRGVAGAGKTTMMKELTGHIEKTGSSVSILAPTAEAARGVLTSEGFKEANTVAGFLSNKKEHEKIYRGTVIVDEAGLLGTTDTLSLLKVADEQQARLIFVGDTRQHSSVVRGDAMRILNTVANIKAAEVTQIRRQKDKLYKSAVEDLSKGDIGNAFEKLNTLDAIKAVAPTNTTSQIADDYVGAVKANKSVLIVSPTHQEGGKVTEAVRRKLLENKLLGKKELAASKLLNRNLTEAEKSDWRNYQEDNKIRFNQHVPRIARGSLWTVGKVEQGKITVSNAHGESQQLPIDRAAAFDVFTEQQLSLRKGDKVRITRNGFDLENKRLNNGQSLDVEKITKSGRVTMRSQDGKTTYELDKDFGHLDHAYCITSHSSQGKTVDQVFVAQPSATFAATDAKQFYVSVSRGKESVTIYTDDRKELLANASRRGERQSAIELVDNANKRHTEHVLNTERNKQSVKETASRSERQERPDKTVEHNYEP